MKMRKFLVLLLSLIVTCLFTASCSPQKRVARIVERYNLEKTQEVTIFDTVVLEQQKLDTFYLIKNQTDTFFCNVGNATIATVIKGDTVYQVVKLNPDTIYREIIKKVPYLEVKKDNSPSLFGKICAFFFFIGFLLVCLYVFLWNKINGGKYE